MRQPPTKSFARNRKMRLALCLLAFRAVTTAQTDAPPDTAEQERILTLMRQYAASYRMPDVAYDYTTTSFDSPAGSNKWHQRSAGDSSRLVHDGREYWCVTGKNGKPSKLAKWKEVGIYPTGLFEALASRATLVWDRWDTLRARRFAVFNYSVGQQDSKWILPERGIASARVPYSGSVHVDPVTGAIWRVSEVVNEIPARFKTRHISGVRDYDQVAMGTTQYLLLMTHSVIIRPNLWDVDERDDWVYRNYHKFDADSSITFFGADSSITYKK
jgi:hypothetical protein